MTLQNSSVLLISLASESYTLPELNGTRWIHERFWSIYNCIQNPSVIMIYDDIKAKHDLELKISTRKIAEGIWLVKIVSKLTCSFKVEAVRWRHLNDRLEMVCFAGGRASGWAEERGFVDLIIRWFIAVRTDRVGFYRIHFSGRSYEVLRHICALRCVSHDADPHVNVV